MDLSKGFICITNPSWCYTLSSNNMQLACIWLRRTTFKAIGQHQPIFFVEKKSRFLRGYGYFDKFEVNTTRQCWEKYKILNGAKTFNEFLNQLNFPNEEKGWAQPIGNILIKKIKWLNKEIPIHQINVNFPKPTVTGKTINPEEIKILLSYFNA